MPFCPDCLVMQVSSLPSPCPGPVKMQGVSLPADVCCICSIAPRTASHQLERHERTLLSMHLRGGALRCLMKPVKVAMLTAALLGIAKPYGKPQCHKESKRKADQGEYVF